MGCVATLQLGPFLSSDSKGSRCLLGDAVPDVLDKLNALGDGESSVIEVCCAHEESENQHPRGIDRRIAVGQDFTVSVESRLVKSNVRTLSQAVERN